MDDQINLMERGYFIQSLGEAVSSGEIGLRHVPSLLARILDEDIWRSRTVVQTRELAEFDSFEEFVTASPPKGLGTTLDRLQRLCSDDPTLMARIAKEASQPVQEPSGIKFRSAPLDDLGSPHAPPGSKPWSVWVANELRVSLYDSQQARTRARSLRAAFKKHNGPAALGYKSWPEYCQKRLQQPAREVDYPLLSEIGSMDREGLLELIMLAEARLAELDEELEPVQETSSGPAGKAREASGWYELKMIPGANGKLYGPYIYKRWRQGKTLRSQYLGKVKQEKE